MNVSIIIPVLNEREDLPETLHALELLPDVHEIIIVDGGSTDGTSEWLSHHAKGARVVRSTRGRGNQLNAGVRAASGEICLFLHADTCLPTFAVKQIKYRLADTKIEGGAFCLRFRETKPWTLRVIAAGINFRTRLFHRATGDQAIFCRKSSFAKAGGFPEWPICEDIELVKRLRHVGAFAIVPSHVITSARRYIAWGPLRTTLLMFVLQAGYRLGVSPFRLYKWYRDVRYHPLLDLEGQTLPRNGSFESKVGNENGHLF